MDQIQIIALVIFLVSVGVIIWGKLDRAAVGILGVVLLVLCGVMNEKEAFLFVDWNVIAILLGVWIIAAYFGKTGIPQYLAVIALRLSRNNIAVFAILIGIISGFISMFVDNVVVILMMAPVIFHITQKIKTNSFPFIIAVGLGANYMGTAMLLGDLPPQMLHSVAGVEFPEFIWQSGRPSSFILLTISFLITMFFMYRFKFKKLFSTTDTYKDTLAEIASVKAGDHIKNKRFAIVSVGLFLLTILVMSFRQVLGLYLGFIAVAGMIILVIINEIFSKSFESPRFEEIIADIDFRALMFYIVLFALVGGINHVGIINILANTLTPYFQSNLALGTTLLYWITAPIVGIVEHDAYILVFLNLIKDLAASASINPWPLYWGLLWAGTLGSNLTIAGAPALFVAQNLSEKEDNRKVPLKEFFSYSLPFVLVSLVIQFALLMFFWVIL